MGRRLIGIVLCLAMLGGCAQMLKVIRNYGQFPGDPAEQEAPSAQAASPGESEPADTTDRPNIATTQPAARLVALDPSSPLRPQVHLTIYQLTVPAGTVSRNSDLWKRVDEQAVDALTYDVLYRNGIRVGRSPMSEIEFFRKVIERQPVQSRPVIYAASGARTVELPMKRGVDEQIIADYDMRSRLTIRSYERGDYVFRLEFQPAPRKSGSVRVALCPMVRALRKRFAVTAEGDGQDVEYVSPEAYFDLSIRSDVASDQFLLVAPSPEAGSPTSLGRAFLMRQGAAEMLEDVLLLVPQAVQLGTVKPAEEKPVVEK